MSILDFSTTFTCHALEVLSASPEHPHQLTGHTLTLARLLTAGSHVNIVLGSLPAVEDSHNALNTVLRSGAPIIYGVNTGFGGSAGARTTNHHQLQVALIQMLNSASNGGDPHTTSMPLIWVRAAMLVRTNTLLRGHSGVSWAPLVGVLHMLNHGITPAIPMLGSISASGDLTPLSYVVSALQGNPTTMVYYQAGPDQARFMSADKALSYGGILPHVCGPKEALAIVNGTAFSDAVGGLLVHDAMILAMLAQLLTAMAVEAMRGHVESFDPYIGTVKNDVQQEEIARNIRFFLEGSKLAQGTITADTDHKDAVKLTIGGTVLDRNQKLAQDRYALRTSAQWLSPPTQDILAAFGTLSKAINSTTDNPIVDSRDPSNSRILNGGNFQGSATAGAMDKTRSALQLIGKLMFAQSTEVINPMTNNGLPPNLAATEPSMDFCCKGLDINIAAYQSELGWNSNPVGPHVQNAEMLNQSVNSLALISARKTSDSVSVLQKMMASNLYIMCQALDVRVMQEQFFALVEFKLDAGAMPSDDYTILEAPLREAVRSSWEGSGSYDLLDRVNRAVNAASQLLLPHYIATAQDGASAYAAFQSIKRYQDAIRDNLWTSYNRVRDKHFIDYAEATPQYLNKHTAAMYNFIRNDLGVPMFQGLEDNPTRENGKKAIGGHVGDIEAALGTGAFIEVLGKAVRDVAGMKALFPGERS
jgi:phenylalanine ammonia-lyase